MAKVLVATLGDHPIVVTAMVQALHEIKDIHIEVLHILYPGKESDRLIPLGYDMIVEHLQGVCQIQGWPLNFADPHSYEDSIVFLRTLAGVLDLCERHGNDVYLSLAGGRKNMSVLLAVITQFYPCVRGLYHILDRYEYDERRRNFYTIEELIDMDEDQRAQKLSPPVKNLKLVEIPYKWFANAYELRRYFAAVERDEDFILQTSGAADAFFSAIFQPQTKPPLQVYLSETAWNEYEGFDPTIRRRFDQCFHRMTNPQLLEKHKHRKFKGLRTDCYCFKMGQTRERPFYYREGNYVIVCRLTLEGSSYERLIEGGELWKVDHPPYKALAELRPGEAVLLVPLGETPMIATQTYVLLQEREQLRISLIVVLYPYGHAPARNSANLLEDLCNRRDIPFEKRAIRNLKDVDSYKACEIFLSALMKAIDDLRVHYPDKRLVLSLSGGRKGMSVLTLFAAQKRKIEQVYHTLITDIELEKQIERECSLKGLENFTPKQQAEKLFLDVYDQSEFTLFPIPVIFIE
jgi:hypothetical protein